MYEIMGFREGILILPNGRKLPINIDYCNMRSDCIPEMRISVIPGMRGRIMLGDSDCRERSEYFKPFVLPPINPMIEKVIFNNPATIVLWEDGTKTVVKCQAGDTYSKELGLAMCISKKYLGNKGNFNNVFKKWIPEERLYTEEELVKILANVDFHKIGETLRNVFYNFEKALVEVYKPEEPVEETPEKNDIQDEEETPEPVEEKPEYPLDEKIQFEREFMINRLHYYCSSAPCDSCKIFGSPDNCEHIINLSYDELSKAYDRVYKK